MLSVTVMMFRLIVESVMLLKDEDWKGGRQIKQSQRYSHNHCGYFFFTGTWDVGKPVRGTHPVYFGHFVPPSAAFMSAHQLRGRALFRGAAESETQFISIQYTLVHDTETRETLKKTLCAKHGCLINIQYLRAYIECATIFLCT